jgi:hypothetical protein
MIFNDRGILHAEQHEAMHSNRKGSQLDQLHSFWYIPVLRSLQDNTSNAVAIINFQVAWDVPLRNALYLTSESEIL